MRSIRVLPLLLLLTLLTAGRIQAQLPASNPAAFRASLSTFQKQCAELQKILTSIKMEEFPISYAQGKLIERTKHSAIESLDLSTKLSTRILRSGSLADEINLLSTIQQVSADLHDLAGLLLDIDIKAQSSAKVTTYATAQSLMDLDSGPITTFFVEVFNYVTSHADEVEQGNKCPLSK